jgi:hypothetical protein
MFRELIKGGNVTIAGVNIEMDEAMMEFKKTYKGSMIFRGKENFG